MHDPRRRTAATARNIGAITRTSLPEREVALNNRVRSSSSSSSSSARGVRMCAVTTTTTCQEFPTVGQRSTGSIGHLAATYEIGTTDALPRVGDAGTARGWVAREAGTRAVLAARGAARRGTAAGLGLVRFPV